MNISIQTKTHFGNSHKHNNSKYTYIYVFFKTSTQDKSLINLHELKNYHGENDNDIILSLLHDNMYVDKFTNFYAYHFNKGSQQLESFSDVCPM